MKTHAIRPVLPWILSVFVLFSCCACGKKNPPPAPVPPVEQPPVPAPAPVPPPSDFEEGSLHVIIQNRDTESSGSDEPEVRVSRENITISEKSPFSPIPGKDKSTGKKKRNTWDKVTETPANSLAARIPHNTEVTIQWAPQWVHSTTGMVRVPDVRISPDRSLIAFVETTGEAAGPFASRIILMNTHSWEILRIMEISDRYIVRLAFLPGTDLLAALCEKQVEDLKQPAGIAVYNLISGKETAFALIKEQPGKQFLASRSGKIYLTVGSDLLCFDAKHLNKAPRKNALDVENPPLALSQDQSRLAVALPGQVQFFKTGDLRPISTISLPEKLTVQSMTFLQDRDLVVFPDRRSENQDAWFLRNGTARKIASGVTGVCEFDSNSMSLTLGLRLRGALQHFQIPTLTPGERIVPSEIRPVMTGDPRFLFHIPANQSYAIMDDQGNFYLICKPSGERRHRKEAIFSSKK